jgi:hypothetical protein
MKIFVWTGSHGIAASSVPDMFRQTGVQQKLQWITSLSFLYKVKGVICDFMVNILAISEELALEPQECLFLALYLFVF